VTTEAGSDKITRTRVHGRLEQEDFPVAKVSDYLNEPDTVVWVDLCAPDAADLDLVATELGLHALAIEDAVPDSAPSSTATPPTSSSTSTPPAWTTSPGPW
jgi:hypothetical protein